jgi:hypothetical protein
VVLLSERAKVTPGFTMDEHGDLRGSDRWSVIPYVHGKKGHVLSKRWLFLSVALSGLEHSNTRCSLL